MPSFATTTRVGRDARSVARATDPPGIEESIGEGPAPDAGTEPKVSDACAGERDGRDGRGRALASAPAGEAIPDDAGGDALDPSGLPETSLAAHPPTIKAKHAPSAVRRRRERRVPSR